MKKLRSSYWQLLPFLRTQTGTIGRALVCTLIFTAFWPQLAQLAGTATEYLSTGQVGKMAQLSGVLAIAFLINKTAQYGQDSLMAKAALNIALALRKATYIHLQNSI
ncbi:MAG: ABC transporter ATP-binding protein [Synechococcales cyanobacterium RU_4_20]|nr:ABC transporter ATP-binding protein [Synechococcales cyanobacterium RU_4_20]